MKDGFGNICIYCAWFLQDQEAPACAAFPEGIPAEIWSGEVIHALPVQGDNGIQYLKGGVTGAPDPDLLVAMTSRGSKADPDGPLKRV